MIPAYDVKSYRLLIQMSSMRRLLVEGKDDRVAFRCLFDSVLGQSVEVAIDTAETISSDGILEGGNRAKVEFICRDIRERIVGVKPFSGFVDREYRDFDIDGVTDLYPQELVESYLARSRGHSIENYWFSFDIFREAVLSIAATEHFLEAIGEFENSFDGALKLGCTVSLVAKQMGMNEAIRRALDWECVIARDQSFGLDEDRYGYNLWKRMSMTKSLAKDVLRSFRYWEERVREATVATARWISHGHIGLSVIWACYGAVLYQVTNDETEAREIYGLAEGPRSNACASAWSRKAAAGLAEAPWGLLAALNP